MLPILLSIALSILFGSSSAFSSTSEEALEALNLQRDKEGKYSVSKRIFCETDVLSVMEETRQARLPFCSDEESDPQIQSSLHPTTALFVSCSNWSPQCLSLVKSFISLDLRTTINVLAAADWLDDTQNITTLLKMNSLASRQGVKLNVLPTNIRLSYGSSGLSSSLPVFIRDAGIFRTSSEGLEYVLLPQSEGRGAAIGIEEALAACKDVRVFRSYATTAEFSATKLSIVENPKKSSLAMKRSEGNLTTFEHEINAMTDLVLIEKASEHDYLTVSQGGNILPLSKSVLFVGKEVIGSQKNPKHLPKRIEELFRKTQSIYYLALPKLHIGHLDELFAIVPNPSDMHCGFSILRASPHEAIKFMEAHADSFQIETLADKYDFANLLSDEKDEFEELMYIQYLERVTKRETTIQKALEKLLRIIERDINPTCHPRIVDIPVFWGFVSSFGGFAEIPNAINGIFVNGKYLYPKQRILGAPELEQKLQNHVRSKITLILPTKDVSEIDTSGYDEGAGSLHCATTQIHRSCIPR